MANAILVLNAGSSSLKFALFAVGDQLTCEVRGHVDRLQSAPEFVAHDADGQTLVSRSLEDRAPLRHADAVALLLGWASNELLAENTLVGVGHRIVHGGAHFSAPVRIDDEVIAEIDRLTPFAPLHQPHHLAAIRGVTDRLPDVAQVACFDTAFHQTLPVEARNYALPRRLTDQGIRRYGFHGISYEFITSALSDHDPAAAKGRTIIAHLGNGVSMCAVHQGRSIATTMGFTPLDGLPMGTRSGSVDPGILLYLMNKEGYDYQSLHRLLWKESGLLGVSGNTHDMRALLASPDPRAAEAVNLFVYRIQREVGSLTAALGGLDAIVLTGGIGTHSAEVRRRVCDGLNWLGVQVDSQANEWGGPQISAPDSAVRIWALPTDEERMIAEHTLRLLRSS